MSHGINVDYINPFIEATVHTFQTMCQIVPTREKLFIKKRDSEEIYGISGIIGLKGEMYGTVILNFPEQIAIRMVSKIAGEEQKNITATVVDGVGEILNIIAGDAKNRLVQKGYKFDIGLPKIVTGRNYVNAQKKSDHCIVITFISPFGKFSLEVSLKKAA